MIGDRERPDDPGDVPQGAPYEPEEGYGPLDAMVRLNPPGGLPPAWVERYGRLIVLRHTWPGAPSSVTECPYGTEADALRAMAHKVAFLIRRGYHLVVGDGPPPL